MLIKEIKLTELSVCGNTASFLQSAMWGEFKSRFGWKAAAFIVDWEGYESKSLLTLSRRLAPGFSITYIPWGPELPENFPEENRVNALEELAEKLKPFLARNTVFVRFDPPWFITENIKKEESLGFNTNSKIFESEFKNSRLKQSSANVQPPDTVIIDLKPSCEEILSDMKPKWRYNINLSAKKGVVVNVAKFQDIEIFYRLLKETAARDGLSIHNINYYKTLFEICSQQNSGNKSALQLYTACHENDTLAAIAVLFMGKTATYLYGASSNVKRNLMPPYALQCKAMQDAKEAGCEYYDLFGIPPDKNPNHPMAGLYLFKTGFGGQIIHRPGTWDYPYKPLICFLFKTAESLRKKIMNLRKNRRRK